MPFLDTAIVIGIVIFFLFVMYKALKEPIDMFFGWIKNLIGYIKGKAKDQDDTYEVIRYG